MNLWDYCSRVIPDLFHRLGAKHRTPQLTLSAEILYCMLAGYSMKRQAPTGVGKSFAYLSAAAVSPGRTVIATHTKNLMRQLEREDLPRVMRVQPRRWAVLKGRRNYHCLIRGGAPEDAPVGWNGDRLHLTVVPDNDTWSKRSASRPECDAIRGGDGRNCEYYRDEGGNVGSCYYEQAKHRASNAEILVTNHAMLVVDGLTRASGDGLLGHIDNLVIDEAHSFADSVRNFLGWDFAHAAVHRKIQDEIERTQRQLEDASGSQERMRLHDVLSQHRDAAVHLQALFSCFERLSVPYRKPKQRTPRIVVHPRVLDDAAIYALHYFAARGDSSAASVADDDDEKPATHFERHCLDLLNHDDSSVYMYDPEEGRLSKTPVDVTDWIQRHVYAGRNVIALSATLPQDISGQIGVGPNEVQWRAVEHVYDWKGRVQFECVHGTPYNPSTREGQQAFRNYVANEIYRVFREHHVYGGILILCPSFDDIRAQAEFLAGYVPREKLCVQERETDVSGVIDRFKEAGNGVAIGTYDSLGTGVDVRGPALSCVVLTRAPFPAPAMPAFQWYSHRNRQWEYRRHVASLKVNQGIGRLLRGEDDWGRVVLLDRRIRDLIDPSLGVNIIDRSPVSFQRSAP